MDRSNRQSSATGHDWLAWVLVWLIALLAFFTRLYRLADLWPIPYFDPAYNGLDILRVMRTGVLPIFFPANGGREPLFLYLQTLSIWALGANTFALRLPSALAGALTVPLLFGFTRALLADEGRPLARWVPAWASLGLALAAWHVSQTREGLRVALLPLISIGVFWLFVVGWRQASLPRLAVAGALLGLSMYTYTAARFLPFVLGLAALPDLLTRPGEQALPRWQRWLGLGVLALTAVLVFAPLGWYYLRHPAMFDERAASVMIWNVWGPDSGSTLAEELALSLWRTLFWFVRLPLPLSLSLGVGLGLTLARLRRLEYRLLPIWWLILLLPAVVTTETPNLMRSLGAAPPTYVTIGLGLATGVVWLSDRIRLARFYPSATAYVILACGLLVIALSSLPGLVDYFQPTVNDPRAGTQALLNTLTSEAQGNIIYVPLSTYADPSLRFLLGADFERRSDWSALPSPDPVRLVQPVQGPNSPALVRLSPDGWITLLPPLSPDGKAALQGLTDGGQPIADSYGAVIGHLVTLPAASDPARYLVQAESPANASVTGLAHLAGYSLDGPTPGISFPHLAPGGPLWITTFWQAQGGALEDYDLTIRLMDDAGRLWGQADGPPLEETYPTSLWRPGEKIADGRLLWIDPNAPPGRYWLDVAFYDYLNDARLPVVGSSMPDTIRLGPFKVPLPPPTAAPDGVYPQSARVGEVAQLLGYRLTAQPAQVTLSLYWQAEMPDSSDYTVFVHMLDEKGQVVAGRDNQPVSGSYPTAIWEPGEIIPDEYSLDTHTLPPGRYQLEVGMYVLDTGERLPVSLPGGTQDPDRHLLLSTPIEVP